MKTYPFFVQRFWSLCFSDQDLALPVERRKERTVDSQSSKHSLCMNLPSEQSGLLQRTRTASVISSKLMSRLSPDTRHLVGTIHFVTEVGERWGGDDLQLLLVVVIIGCWLLPLILQWLFILVECWGCRSSYIERKGRDRNGRKIFR